jgi:hypothetical protein
LQQVNVVFSGNNFTAINVYDCVGRIVKTLAFTGTEKAVSIDVNNWPEGIYIIQAVGTQGVISKSFVVEK